MTSVLTHIAMNYSNFEQRAQVEELDLSNKSLTGELDFTHLGFNNLKKLILINNQLTKLVLKNPQQITYLDVSNNQLTYLNTSELSPVLTFGEIKNNPLPDETKKDWLIKRWNYYKDLEIDWPDKLVPQITKLVDISDLDNFVLNYDFSREGNQDYHQIIGNGFTSLLDEKALELLSQQVLARCLIKQNELIEGKNEDYEQKINGLSLQFQRASDMFVKSPLKAIQREVIRELAGEKDLTKEFQNQLEELEIILRNGDESIGGIPDLELIKNKITNLQTTIQKQKEIITQLRQVHQEQKQLYNKLWETNQKGEEKLNFYSDNVKTKESIINDYKQEVSQLGTKIQELTETEANEKLCRERIVELEEEIITNSTTLKNEFNALLKNKDTYITQLESVLGELKENKKEIEENLTAVNSLNEKLIKKQESPNYWKWGGIGAIILIVFVFGYWLKRKFIG